ncbi:Homeobox protein Dlx2a [Ilyodon furcidens]|uniref:Homeobox protein Dlx2a n=1 Tax=Ilyodon furcidens TaxID=33524 RepID=A0ABV0UPU1_9TELE
MTGVFENLNADMHSNQITSNSYHSLHKSQESPTLPVSTATDSSFYNNQQPGHCAGSPFGQLGSYQYHGSATGSVPYPNAKSYDLAFNSSYGAYGSYGSNSSPTPAETGNLSYWTVHAFCEFYAFVYYVSDAQINNTFHNTNYVMIRDYVLFYTNAFACCNK